MSDILTAMYPSSAGGKGVEAAVAAPTPSPAPAAAPAAPATAQAAAPASTGSTEAPAASAAQAAEAVAGKLYANARVATVDGRPKPVSPEPAAKPAAPASAQPAAAQPADGGDGAPAVEALPEIPETVGAVHFAEAPAKATDIRAEIDVVVPEWLEGENVRTAPIATRTRRRWRILGVGKTAAREAIAQVIGSLGQPYVGTPEAGRAQLQTLWGDQTDAKIGKAFDLVKAYVAKVPAAYNTLMTSGKLNDPNFIRLLVAEAEAIGRRKK